MKRLSRRQLLFTDLITSDKHHRRFLRRDLAELSDDEVWAERKLLEIKLASLIWHKDRSAIFGAEFLIDTQEPIRRSEWVRIRLRELQTEGRRRLQRSVA